MAIVWRSTLTVVVFFVGKLLFLACRTPTFEVLHRDDFSLIGKAKDTHVVTSFSTVWADTILSSHYRALSQGLWFVVHV